MDWRRLRYASLAALLVAAPCISSAQVVTSAPPPLMPSASSVAGAALVTSDPQACVNATGFTLSTVTHLPSGGTSRVGTAYNDASACRWVIEGLEPGSYQVHVSTTSGIGGSAAFTAEAGKVTMVNLALPAVQVSGRVLLNGHAVAGADVMFLSRTAAGMPHVVTAADGTYAATLESAGEYDAVVSGPSMKQHARAATFRAGANTLDWTLVGGTLTIHVANWDGLSDVNITLATPTGFHSVSVLEPNHSAVVVLHGTPFGTYEVSAAQDPYRASRKTISVTLAPNQPEAHVTLELGDSRSFLVLSDPDGRPVSGATFARGGPIPRGLDRTPEEMSPGVYSFHGHIPGTPVRIRVGKGLTPVCRHVPFDDVMHVAAKAGRSVQVRTARPIKEIIPDWTLVDLEGSDCPVLLRDFAPTRLPGPANGPATFLFENFPLSDVVVLQAAGRRHELIVSPEGVLVLPF